MCGLALQLCVRDGMCVCGVCVSVCVSVCVRGKCCACMCGALYECEVVPLHVFGCLYSAWLILICV